MTQPRFQPTYSRKLRFALSLGVLALGALAGWLGWSMSQVQEREQLIVDIELAGGEIVLPRARMPANKMKGDLPFWWRACGARPVWWVLLPEETISEAQQERIRGLFPEAHIAPLTQAPNLGKRKA